MQRATYIYCYMRDMWIFRYTTQKSTTNILHLDKTKSVDKLLTVFYNKSVRCL